MSGLARGTCVVSIDTELAWGAAHRRDGSAPAHRYELEREVIGRLLDLFARYEISATWAVVGHLFLDRCARDHEGGRPHPELRRPTYDWLDGDWLDIDPCADAETAPYFYAPDVVDRIAACPVPQEIGSHSFTHAIADDSGCSPEVFASELAACHKAAATRGIELRSFVYPRNAIAHRDTLHEAGFTSYRGGRPSAPFAGRPSWQRRALRAIDTVRPLAGSTVQPEVDASGLVNVAQTYYFAPTTRSRQLPPAVWARFPVARLRQAARQRSLFHLWFHPYDVTAAPDRALDILERICRAIDRERSRGRLDVRTMSQVADLVQERTP
jgi:peptidoglycan/xylan/chitin deacetylase (PgdA/CDA1 family)